MDPEHPASPANKPSPEWQAAASSDPLIGTTIDNGKYTILGHLGKGGMSIVYKARHNAMDRIVAVKTLKMQMLSDPKIVARFEREVKLLSKLDHPNVVTVYNCVMVQNQPYFVMDCLTGQSLQELLKAEGRLTPQRAQHIFIQCCAAVEHAHRKGVIHRDIKPGNIMITPGSGGRDMVKVVDFGLARLAEDAQKLTQSGEIWGSPLYMSPEQASALELDARSDIYSLGTVMFETLTGTPPFRGKNFMETMQMQIHEPAPSMRAVAPTAKIPKALEDLVHKTLEKEPENRFQTMAALKDALLIAVPSAQSQAQTQVDKQDPQAAIPTVALKRAAVNGYNYQPRKKGWSAKLLAAPLIAFVIIVALVSSFRSLFWQPQHASSNAAAPFVPAHEPNMAQPEKRGAAPPAVQESTAPAQEKTAPAQERSTRPQEVSPSPNEPSPLPQQTTKHTEKPANKRPSPPAVKPPTRIAQPASSRKMHEAPQRTPDKQHTAAHKRKGGGGDPFEMLKQQRDYDR